MEERARSECCGATLYQYEDNWGICGDCKEWSQSESDADAFTLNNMNKIAEELFGEFGFATCTEQEQVAIVKELTRNPRYRNV